MVSTTPITRFSLLVRIRDVSDADAWLQFVDLYAPVLHGFYRKRGLQDADAADLTQQVLESVTGGSKYDLDRGKFRSWLLMIAQCSALRSDRVSSTNPETNGDALIGFQLQRKMLLSGSGNTNNASMPGKRSG